MKTLKIGSLTCLLLLLTQVGYVWAQGGNVSVGGYSLRSGASVPASCSGYGLFFKNTATRSLSFCAGGTTYTTLGTGSGTVTSVLGTTNQINSDGSATTPTLSLSSTIVAPGTITATTSTASPFYASTAADPADAGAIRLGNAESIAWEASPAGTDVTLSVDASELFQFSNNAQFPNGSAGSPSIIPRTGFGIGSYGSSEIDINVASSAQSLNFYVGSTLNSSFNFGSTLTQLRTSAATTLFLLGTQMTTATSGTGIRFSNSAVSWIPTSGTVWHIQEEGTFAPTSGTAAWSAFIVNPTINQTGGANGTIRVLGAYPVNTAVVGTEYLLALGTATATGTGATLTDKFTVDNSGNAVAQGSMKIGAGTAILKVLSASATLDFGNLAAIGCEDLTITVTGAALGDTTTIGVPNGSVPGTTAQFTGWVSATDTVTIRYCDLVSGNPASGTFRATVTQF